MIHYIHSYINSNLHPITIDLVGCGGTGSHLLTRLARMNNVLLKLGHKGIVVRAWDFDYIEENNVGRQSFTNADIGKNKAECLIRKINMAFSFDWIAVPQRFNEPKIKANILISCVDNVKTRTSLHRKFRKKKRVMNVDYNTSLYWIDCGNGKDFGQVVLGSHKITQPKSKYETIRELPTILERFPDLYQYENEEIQGIEGCSMEESLAKQDLFINDMIAVQAADILWKMFRYKFLNISGSVLNLEKLNSKGFSLSL